MSRKGFASLDPARLKEIARLGGKAVPKEMRSFSTNRQTASDAGRKGGQSVPNDKRSFSKDRKLAAEAGRKGALARIRSLKEAAQP